MRGRERVTKQIVCTVCFSVCLSVCLCACVRTWESEKERGEGGEGGKRKRSLSTSCGINVLHSWILQERQIRFCKNKKSPNSRFFKTQCLMIMVCNCNMPITSKCSTFWEINSICLCQKKKNEGNITCHTSTNGPSPSSSCHSLCPCCCVR